MRYSFNYLVHGLCWLSIALYSSACNAEGSMTIIGGSTLAVECYHSSSIAARTGFSSKEDIESCNDAITYGQLKLADMVATLVNRGIINVALENFQSALNDYQKAMRLQPGAAEAYLNRGNLLFMAQRYEEAISDYQTSLQLEIKQPAVAQLNIGMSYEYMGKPELAKQQYELALTLIPEWPTAIEKLTRVNKTLMQKNQDGQMVH